MLTAPRTREPQTRTLPCSETCCLHGLVEQSSFGTRWEGEGEDGELRSPAPRHPHITRTTEMYRTPPAPAEDRPWVVSQFQGTVPLFSRNGSSRNAGFESKVGGEITAKETKC